MDISPFIARRKRLAEAMRAGVAVVPTAPPRLRNRDSHYPYRYDSYFYYLTGFAEPDAALVMVAGEQPRTLLFCRDKDEQREIWDGFRFGPAAAREAFGFDEAYPIAQVDEKLAELLGDQPVLYFALGQDGSWDKRVIAALNKVRADTRAGKTAPPVIHDPRAVADEMRLIKDEHELALMRRAADVSAAAHRRAMRRAVPGTHEYEVEAEILHEFRQRGAQAPAYVPIVAGGASACILHYVANDGVLHDGDLLLIDAGCEIEGYAADLTRTFPVGGRFTGAQRQVYELVLAAQAAAIEQIRPGARWDAPHDAAVRVLAQGMIDFRLIGGSLDEAIESGSYKRFYMHRTGHWLGLDVHDAGAYKVGGQWRALAPGMTLTVEPGCYIRAAPDVPQAFWNIGVRVEDDALVTAGGCEILTAAAPKSIDDIEALLRDRR